MGSPDGFILLDILWAYGGYCPLFMYEMSSIYQSSPLSPRPSRSPGGALPVVPIVLILLFIAILLCLLGNRETAIGRLVALFWIFQYTKGHLSSPRL